MCLSQATAEMDLHREEDRIDRICLFGEAGINKFLGWHL